MAGKIPIIALVGRPNVGKSTLFNRIVGSRRAIIDDQPGVTRDRNYALVEGYQFPFWLVDTGGFEKEPKDEIAKQVVNQTLAAIAEADVIAAIFDGPSGLAPGDYEVVAELRKSEKPVVFVINKCDSPEQGDLISEFYSLGADRFVDVSALHGHGMSTIVNECLQVLPDFKELAAIAEKTERAREEAEETGSIFAGERKRRDKSLGESAEEMALMERVFSGEKISEEPMMLQGAEPDFPPVFVPGGELFESIEDYEAAFKIVPLPLTSKRKKALEPVGEVDEIEEQEETAQKLDCIRIAVVGKPNVGKSTLLNTLLGEDRTITSPVAGTTRDSLEFSYESQGQRLTLIDTAGLRRQSRVSEAVERYSVLAALRAISSCDVAIVMIDASEGITEQDEKVAGLAHEQGCGMVLAVNKWELVEKDHRAVKKFTDEIRERTKFANYAPIVFISAKTGRRCQRLLETAVRVAYERARWIPTGKLNRVLGRAVRTNPPPIFRDRRLKLYYAAQVTNCPPRFALFYNNPTKVHFSYRRYLKNAIRDAFGFVGTDIVLFGRKR